MISLATLNMRAKAAKESLLVSQRSLTLWTVVDYRRLIQLPAVKAKLPDLLKAPASSQRYKSAGMLT